MKYTFQGIRILPVLHSYRPFSIFAKVAALFSQSRFTNSWRLKRLPFYLYFSKQLSGWIQCWILLSHLHCNNFLLISMCCNLRIILILTSVSVVAICNITPLFVAAAGCRQSHASILINCKRFATQNTTWLTQRLVIIEVHISLFLFLFIYSVWVWDSLFSWIIFLDCFEMPRYI